MIRRGFWLLTGAALGVTGYRRATRLARALTGQNLLGAPAATQQRNAIRPAAARRAVQSGRAQPQLVPPGTAQPRQPARTRPAQTESAPRGPAPRQPVLTELARTEPAPRQQAPMSGGPTPAARIAAAAARATAAAGFVRDVRDGMAEYWDLHRSESGRTLGSQRDHMWSGSSEQGTREH
jgi:hypothetical protein